MIYPPNQKPPIWSIDPGVIAYNCQRAGIPHPVVAMPMWEGAGSLARDYSGHGNHGTINGADWETGGLKFVSANNDYVNFGDVSEVEGGHISISLWAYITGLGGYNLFSKDSWDMSFHSHVYTNNTLYWGYSYDSGDRVGGTTNIFTLNEWQNIVLWFDGLNWKTYTNGIEKQSFASKINTIPNTATDLTLGTSVGVVDCTVANVLIHNTPPSDAQIKFLYNNPYFIYQIPEELYGYSPSAVGAIMNPFQKANLGADLYNGAIIA